jgi:hypothetical protein
MRLGFRIGPFYLSQRLGRTQTQKRAAVKQRAEAQRQREHARRMASPEVQGEIAAAHARIDRTYTGPVTVSSGGRSLTVTDDLRGSLTISAPDDRFGLLHDGDVVRLTANEDGTALEGFEHLWYANGRNASEKSPLNWLRSAERARLFAPPPSPEELAAREAAQADHDQRTYRAVISECRIDGLKGGAFTIEADGRDSVRINVLPETAVRFLSLRKGDIVQVTLAPGNAGLEEFRHLSRANGAKPRSPVDLTAADMGWHGFTVEAEPHPPT